MDTSAPYLVEARIREEEEEEEEQEEKEEEEEEDKEEEDGDEKAPEEKKDESAAQTQKRPAWAPSFFYRVGKEVYHYVGEKITIVEGLDSYAGMIWPAALALCHHLETHYQDINLVDKAVLEIGAGTGLVSVVATLLGAWVTATDLPVVLNNLRVNLSRNTRGRCRHTPQVAALSWGYDLEDTYPSSVYHYDYVLAADVVYHHDFLDELLATMKHFCRPGTTLIWANKVRFETDLTFTENFKKAFRTRLLAEDGEMKIFMATCREGVGKGDGAMEVQEEEEQSEDEDDGDEDNDEDGEVEVEDEDEDEDEVEDEDEDEDEDENEDENENEDEVEVEVEKSKEMFGPGAELPNGSGEESKGGGNDGAEDLPTLESETKDDEDENETDEEKEMEETQLLKDDDHEEDEPQNNESSCSSTEADSTEQYIQPTWRASSVSCISISVNKDMYHYAGHDIIIQESIDSFGAVMWPAALALCSFLENNTHRLNLQGKEVLELGAGTGLVTIVASLLGASVTATDLPEVLSNLRANVLRNTRDRCRRTPEVEALSWGFKLERTHPAHAYHYDYVLAADVVYHHDFLDELLATMKHFCGRGTTLIWANRVRFETDLTFTENFKKAFHTRLLAEDGEMKIFMATCRE